MYKQWAPGLPETLLGVWLTLARWWLEHQDSMDIHPSVWLHPSILQLTDRVLPVTMPSPLTDTAIPVMVVLAAEGAVFGTTNTHLLAASGSPPVDCRLERVAAVVQHVSGVEPVRTAACFFARGRAC
jgi:hypothetical protein